MSYIEKDKETCHEISDINMYVNQGCSQTKWEAVPKYGMGAQTMFGKKNLSVFCYSLSKYKLKYLPGKSGSKSPSVCRVSYYPSLLSLSYVYFFFSDKSV